MDAGRTARRASRPPRTCAASLVCGNSGRSVSSISSISSITLDDKAMPRHPGSTGLGGAQGEQRVLHIIPLGLVYIIPLIRCIKRALERPTKAVIRGFPRHTSRLAGRRIEWVDGHRLSRAYFEYSRAELELVSSCGRHSVQRAMGLPHPTGSGSNEQSLSARAIGGSIGRLERSGSIGQSHTIRITRSRSLGQDHFLGSIARSNPSLPTA